ncbi:MAG: preprotein translocase subunit SecE [Candidatus Promineofilum sp.]|nr:preprotein translocase subunit SecE [Promineifilum sp.]
MSKKEETVAVPRENPLNEYIRETRGELRKVTWPTRDEAWRLTAIVLAVTAAFAVFLWATDSLFSNMIRLIIEQIIGL